MKKFRYYPGFNFIEVKPFSTTVTIGDKTTVTEIPNILRCKLDVDEKASYLYYKDIRRLYKIVDNAGLFGMILHDMRNNKYNMASLVNGTLRFDIHNEPVIYCKSEKLPPKLYMFGYCVKERHSFHYEWIDDMKIYNYNIPVHTIDKVTYDRKK